MRTRWFASLALIVPAIAVAAEPPSSCDIHRAVLETTGKTAEVSTAELRQILADHSATVLDARPPLEFAMSHIPGALNVAPKAGMPKSAYVSDVAEIERLVHGAKTTPLVLYCNGPQCGKSKRLADSLLAAGFANVRRYQLGIPVWRALGGVTEIEAPALRLVIENDRTAVVIDVREPDEFKAGTLPTARSLPRSGVVDAKDQGEVRRAKDDGRLPMEDHNTRVLVVGKDAEQARVVAQAIAREAFHNVSYFPGTIGEARAAVR